MISRTDFIRSLPSGYELRLVGRRDITLYKVADTQNNYFYCQRNKYDSAWKVLYYKEVTCDALEVFENLSE